MFKARWPDNNEPRSTENPMASDRVEHPVDHRLERFVALGVAVLIVIFCTAVIWRDKPVDDPNTSVFMRILLSVACGVLGGTIPGFLNVQFDVPGLAIRAVGGIALAVLTYTYTPTVLHNIQSPTERALDRARTGDIGRHFKLVNDYWDIPSNRNRYQATDLADRPQLLVSWVGDDSRRNKALREVTGFISDVHVCIQTDQCDKKQLCNSSLLDDTDNFLIFFDPLLSDWAESGYAQTYANAKAFINCDCVDQRNAKRCPNHPSMCSAAPKCVIVGPR
jgi:hypothetical protein